MEKFLSFLTEKNIFEKCCYVFEKPISLQKFSKL